MVMISAISAQITTICVQNWRGKSVQMLSDTVERANSVLGDDFQRQRGLEFGP